MAAIGAEKQEKEYYKNGQPENAMLQALSDRLGLEVIFADILDCLKGILEFQGQIVKDFVLIIDDFLANGEAATGAIRLLRKAHATVAGLGILIEKSFQPGRDKLKEQGIHVYSLARISKLAENYIEFIPEEV